MLVRIGALRSRLCPAGTDLAPIPPRPSNQKAIMTTDRSIPHRTLMLGAGVLLAAASAAATASSHREAPFIAQNPKVDATDFYLFRSYEPGRDGYVTVLANYQPLQDAYGGPNYFSMDPDALYEIHFDQNGDAKEDLTFQFRFRNTLKDIQLPVGGKMVSIPLSQAGAIAGVNPATLNLRETFTVDVVTGNRRSGTRAAVTHTVGGGTAFDKPVDNIGAKTIANYEAYANLHVHTVNIPGCGAPAKVFVGQRKDPFAVNLGEIFDLFNLNPLGGVADKASTIDDKNVTTIALELPVACVVGSGNIVGGWTTASLRQGRLLDPTPTAGHGTTDLNGGAWTQVSRLGMPLVNEVVIGLKDKDRFNGSKPEDDAQFADYVTNPTLPALIELLYPSAPAPTRFPRSDLVAAFLTGIAGVNQPAGVTPSEMLRLNASIPPTLRADQNNLGVLGGDNAGFPNGRRPGDDVVDAELRVAMGVLCHATGAGDALAVGCQAGDAPAGLAPLTDQVRQQSSQFTDVFPYLRTPIAGSPAVN